MNRTVSKAAAAAMAAVMCLGFSACGKKNEAAIASKEHIYSAQKIELPTSLDYVSNLLYANEKLYIVGSKYTDLSGDIETEKTEADSSETEAETESTETEAETESTETESAETDAAADEPAAETEADDAVAVPMYKNETKLQIVNLDGTLEKEIVLITDDGTGGGGKNISSFTMNKDGNILAVENVYNWDETTGESNNEYFLIKYDGEGNVVSETSLKKLSEEVMKATGNDWFNADYFQIADDGTVLISCNGVICAADDKGNLKYTLKNENAGDNSWMGGLYKAGDGRLLTSISTSRMEGDNYISEIKLYEIDTANQKLGTEYVYAQNGSIMNGTDKYDLLISKDSGLVGYDIETGTTETIIDWLKSGFDATTLQRDSTTVLPDGRILCVGYDYEYNGGGGYSWGGDDLVVNILTEVDPATLPDRKLIKIYALYLNMDVKRQIIQFNRDNPEFEIELTSYDDYAVSNYDDAITKMNNDLIAGNLPDILVLNSNLPVDSYISKGLLADLYEYMDKDETINREDYTESVFKAVERDGKLYELVPNYNLSTVVGKTSEVGDTQGWTMAEFIQTADKYSDKSVFGSEMTRDQFFTGMVQACYSNYINKETGECSFNSDDFKGLMEFATRFPKEIDYETLYEDENYWNEQQAQYRDGKTLLNMANISNFSIVPELEQGAFGEPITFKGVPGASGNGAVFSFDMEIAITSKAANPDGAWEFIKYFLSDEYQDMYSNRDSYGFPIKKSSLQKKAEAAKERPYWEDDEGNKEYYDTNYWFGETQIKLDVNTDEDNQRIFDIIDNATAVGRYDDDITNIITEEAAPFFEGQKSADEVAEIIQNRVSNYIAENR